MERIRRACRADGPPLAALRWQWRVGERGESGLEKPEFTKALQQWMAEREDSHLVWIAEVEGVPAGMVWLAVVERIPGPGTWLRLAGNLQSLYVTPDERGRGIGSRLVDAVVEAARNRQLDYISVHPSAASYALYQRAGFRVHHDVLELDLRRRRINRAV